MYKKDFWEMYVAESNAAGNKCPASRELFLSVWRFKFPLLTIPKYNSLGSCTKCEELRKQKGSFSKNSREYERVTTLIYQHLASVKDGKLFL